MRLNGEHNSWESDYWPTSAQEAKEMAYTQDCEYAHTQGFCVVPDGFIAETQDYITELEVERDVLKEEALSHDKYKELYQQLMVDLHSLLKREDKSDIIDNLAAVVKHSRKQEKVKRSYK
jgi:hypothetical protein